MKQPDSAAPVAHDPLSALKQPSFVLYTANRVAATLGQSLLQAVMAWQVYEISGSALSLGFLGLFRFFPALAMSLIGGAVADTYNRRTILLISPSMPFACAGVLAVATFSGWISLPLIFGLVLLMGFASAFEGPARQALLPGIVRPETFANAVTVSSTVQKLGSVSGPALAGGIIALTGTGPAYIFFCCSTVAAYIPLVLLKYTPSAGGRQKVTLTSIRDGVGFVKRNQVILGSMSLDMFAVIFGGAAALLPVYAADILHAGPSGYGILSSAMQAGAFVTSFVMVWRPPVQRTGRALLLSVIVFGLFTVAFGVSREFWLSVLLYGLIGAADQVSVVMRQTTIQMATPDELRGRVSSVNQVFVQASSQIGAMESGFVAALTSATFAVVSGGAAAAVIAVFVAWRLPELVRYEVVARRARPSDAASASVEKVPEPASGG